MRCWGVAEEKQAGGQSSWEPYQPQLCVEVVSRQASGGPCRERGRPRIGPEIVAERQGRDSLSRRRTQYLLNVEDSLFAPLWTSHVVSQSCT